MPVKMLWQEHSAVQVKYERVNGILSVSGFGEEPPPQPQGTAYCVSTRGNDTNPGTEARPWRTIQYAVDQLRPGDVLYIRAGTYSERVTMNCSGKARKPITIRGYPGDRRPILDGQYRLPTGKAAVTDPKSGREMVYLGLLEFDSGVGYIDVSDLEITGSRGYGVRGRNGSHHNTFTNMYIHDTRGSTFHWKECNDITLQDSEIARSADYCRYQRGPDVGLPWPHSVLFYEVDNAIARRNTVYETYGEGIGIRVSDNGLIEDCVIYDTMNTHLNLDQVTNTTAQRNLVYSTTRAPWSDTPSAGISMSAEGPVEHDFRNVRIINNIVVGCGRNLRTMWKGNTNPDRGPNDTLVAHNVFALGRHTTPDYNYSIVITDHPSNDTLEIRNNIIYQPDAATLVKVSGKAAVWSHNCWRFRPPSQARGAGDVIGDPDMVNPDATRVAGETDPRWYRIQVTSPCRDVAISTTVTEDYWSTARAAKPDIGAHERR